jgi:hypothetical protein
MHIRHRGHGVIGIGAGGDAAPVFGVTFGTVLPIDDWLSSIVLLPCTSLAIRLPSAAAAAKRAKRCACSARNAPSEKTLPAIFICVPSGSAEISLAEYDCKSRGTAWAFAGAARLDVVSAITPATIAGNVRRS